MRFWKNWWASIIFVCLFVIVLWLHLERLMLLLAALNGGSYFISLTDFATCRLCIFLCTSFVCFIPQPQAFASFFFFFLSLLLGVLRIGCGKVLPPYSKALLKSPALRSERMQPFDIALSPLCWTGGAILGTAVFMGNPKPKNFSGIVA